MNIITRHLVGQTRIEGQRSVSIASLIRAIGFRLLLLLVLISCGQSARAQLSNGGFESGTLTGWLTLDSPEYSTPRWYVYSGTTRPVTVTTNPIVNTIPAPPEGTRAAAGVSPDFGYGYSILYRSIALAPAQQHILKLRVAYHNWLAEQQPGDPNIWLNGSSLTLDPDLFQNHTFRVDVIKSTADIGSVAASDVLKSIIRGQNPGDPNLDGAGISAGAMGWTEKTVDLSAYAGQTVVLRFAVSQSLFYLDAFVDDVRLSSTPLTANQPPTAVPGPNQTVHPGVPVMLNGSGSFDDNTPSSSLQYAWSFQSVPPGNTAVLNNANTATPSFTPNVLGNYVVQLIVTDDGMPPLASAPAFVTLSSFNQAPTAVATATPMAPLVGQTVTLNGTGSSDPENDALMYAWTVLMRPAGSTAPLLNATSSIANITPDVAGTYKVQLVVSDFLGAGIPVTVTFLAGSATNFAQAQILAACAIVEGLPPSKVTSKGNQKEFAKHCGHAIKQIQKGNYCKAVKELDKLIPRTDGCPLRGRPDDKGGERDWITDCVAQTDVYNKLIAARSALAGLPDCGDGDDDDDDDH